MSKKQSIAELRNDLADAERALAGAEKRHGPDHQKLCQPLIKLATVHLYAGRQRQAIELFQRCYDIYSRVPDPKPKQLYEIYSSQALARTISGDQAGAIAWFRRALGALDGFKKDFRRERVSLLHTLGALHTILHQAGEAEAAFTQALSLCREDPGRPDPEVPGIYQALAGLYLDLERYEKAEDYCRRAIEADRKANGEETHVYAVSLNRLGKIAMCRGRLDEAEALIRQSLELRERQVGTLHPDYAWSLLNLGELQVRSGRFEEAERSFYHVMTIVDGSLAPDHPLQWGVRHQFARLFIARGFPETAEGHLNRALEILEKAAGPSHPQAARVLLTLAGLHLDNKCAGAALDCFRRALDIVAKTYGQRHPMAAEALKGMAGACEALGRPGEAEKHRAMAADEAVNKPAEQNGAIG